MVQQKPRVRQISAIGEMTTKITNDFVIPDYGAPKQYELLNCSNTLLSIVMDKFIKINFVPHLVIHRSPAITFQQKDHPFGLCQYVSQHITLMKWSGKLIKC